MSHWSQTEEDVACPAFSKPAMEPDIEVEFSLATPMLGGGARSKHPDVEDPIRASAVRSGIRWWWRQAMLSELRALESDRSMVIRGLREAEASLWGKDSQPGSIRVEVESSSENNPKRLDAAPRGRNATDQRDVRELDEVGHAWNLLTDSDVSNNPHVLFDARGKLRIWTHDPLVDQAIQLWLTFGGVGGRTRRGFGVLNHDYPVSLDDFKKLREARATSADWDGPTLEGAGLWVLSNDFNTASLAWAECLRPYSAFRRGHLPSAGRREYQGMESHSRWPESDALREAQQLSRVTHPRPFGQQVPKAALGLPMTLHSVDRGVTQFQDDTLEFGEDGSRWPSPVILRPIKIGSKWRACALILRSPDLDPSKLRWKKGGTQQFDLDARRWPSEWWGPNGFQAWNHGQANAVDAFAAYLTQKAGWKQL